MKLGVIVLNFGEPEEPTLEQVVPFLERIFYKNASLEHLPDEAARRERSRELAERRAPGLIEEYEEIGHSPMNAQARSQADALGAELASRGREVSVYPAFQFTPPLIAEVVARAREDRLDRLIGLPIYPLCGPSTNVQALDDVQSALDGTDWNVEFTGVTGWHRHPLYMELRADAIRRIVAEAGLDFSDPGTRLVFSAHGTPKKYLDEGSRYVEYVEEFCAETARNVGADTYEIGYQNHTNRNIEWTEPDVESVIGTLEAERVVVDPVSFMHEQSETLAELDIELREEAEEAGLEFHRVPVPHDDPRFARVLADLVEAQIEGERSAFPLEFAPCRCRPRPGAVCLNALPREVAAPSVAG